MGRPYSPIGQQRPYRAAVFPYRAAIFPYGAAVIPYRAVVFPYRAAAPLWGVHPSL